MQLRRPTRSELIRGALITLQWLLLTVALGAIVVYAADSLEGYIEPKLGSGFIFLGAFLAAFLLGMSIDSLKLLMPLTVLMCLAASLVFVVVLFAPTFADVTVRTNALQNYAATRVILFTSLMFLPAIVGAGLGNLAGGNVKDDMLSPDDGSGGVDQTAWYERRRHTPTTDTDRS